MANKRFFNKLICEADKFTDLPDKAQLLYFHLNFNADDEGFIDNAKKILAMFGAKKNHLKALIDIGYIIELDSNLYVIAHWWVHNKHDSRDMKPTTHTVEKALIEEDSTTHIYRLSRRVPDGILEENILEENILNNNKSNNTSSRAIYDEIVQAMGDNRNGIMHLYDGESIEDYLEEEEIKQIKEQVNDYYGLIEKANELIREERTALPIQKPHIWLMGIAGQFGFTQE